MRHSYRLFLLWIFVATPLPLAAQSHLLYSPDGNICLSFEITSQGEASFEVDYRNSSILSGLLGLEFADSGPLKTNFRVVGHRGASRDHTYEIPVGKASSARDHHRELTLNLKETIFPHRVIEIAFRAFDDGLAFRYKIPQQEAIKNFVLTDELTRFKVTGDPVARVLPLKNYTTSYEAYYETRPLSQTAARQLFGLPLLLEHSTSDTTPVWMALTEANLNDYAGMYLSKIEGEPNSFISKLSPLPGRDDRAKVLGHTPHVSPWRVLMIADNPGRLIESQLIVHLNEPCAIPDPSWIKPGKTTFPWWNHYVLEGVDFTAGVNTATMKHYIDFCAEYGISYHTLDGLDIAWYGGPIAPRGATDVTTAAPSIDLPELLRYAQQKGVRLRLWMHWRALKPQLEEAFALYEKWGIEGVMIDFTDRDDQEMVRWYHEVARKAAKHHLTVTWHGTYKPTGMERTWPNVLSYEGVLNQEYNKWSPAGEGATPRHNLNAAFIRMLAGPLDYHQGGMRSVLSADYRPRDVAPPVQGTRGHQLAMYVIYQNHLSMMADSSTSYLGESGFEFMVDVPANWDETRVLVAEMDRCLVIARRKGTSWYLGGMTAGDARTLELPLNFLNSGSFQLELYRDQPDQGPTALRRLEFQTDKSKILRVEIPREGGFVGRLQPLSD